MDRGGRSDGIKGVKGMQIAILFDETTRDQLIEKILTKRATSAGVTIPQYLENWVLVWAEGQVRGYYEEKLRNMTLPQVISLMGDIS